MLRRISICGVALALAAPVSAQQQTPQEPNQAAIKFQVRNFESTLKMAVVRGGTEVADKVRDIVPGVDLQFLTDVGVSGWWTADFGYTFDVVIPEIGATVAQLIRNIQQQSAAAPVRPVAGSAGSGRVAGTASGAAPDRMINSPVAPFDPGVELDRKSVV